MKKYLGQQLSMTKIVLIVIGLASILSISISCFVLNEVIKKHDEELIKVIASDVYDDIRNEILKPVIVSQSMANDTFLHEHLKMEETISLEEETAFMANYLKTIKNRFGYELAFLASERTKNYWRARGYIKKLDWEKNPHDIWYKDALDESSSYVLDVGTDEVENMRLGIFIDAKIRDEDGDLLGICGVGLSMERVQRIIATNENAYNIKIDLVSKSGLVQVDTDSENIEKVYLENLNYKQNDQFVLNKLADGSFVITKYMSNLDWYMVIKRDSQNMQSAYANVIFYLSIGFLIALIVLLAFVQLTLKKGKEKVEEEARRHGIASQAGLYVSMHLIDLKLNSVYELSRDPEADLFVIEEGANADDKIISGVKRMTAPDSITELLEFTDLTTLSNRMKNKNAITQEFLSTNYGWCKAYFMPVDRTTEGAVHQAVFAIEMIDDEKRREKHLLYLSETDAMTGLKNRGSGEKYIRDLMERGQEGMFCLLDADKFKSVNDTFGHDVGDKVIIAIADCLKKTFRAKDITLRLGGDEFAFYAVGITEQWEGKMIIDRFFSMIDKIDIPELGERKITVSLGAAIYTVDDECSFEEIYKRADTATYTSKKTVGNCATFYEK